MSKEKLKHTTMKILFILISLMIFNFANAEINRLGSDYSRTIFGWSNNTVIADFNYSKSNLSYNFLQSNYFLNRKWKEPQIYSLRSSSISNLLSSGNSTKNHLFEKFIHADCNDELPNLLLCSTIIDTNHFYFNILSSNSKQLIPLESNNKYIGMANNEFRNVLKNEDNDYIWKSGKAFQWSFYSKYGSNALGLISTLSSIGRANLDSDYITTRTRFQNFLQIGVYTLELSSLNFIGHGGRNLSLYAAQVENDNTNLLKQASFKLRRAKNFGMISTGLGLIGTTALINADYSFDDDLERLIAGLSLGIGSVVFKYISVKNVGEAGQLTARYATFLNEDQYNPDFAGFSRGLLKYDQHWRRGFNLVMYGAGILLLLPPIAWITQSREAVYAGLIGGAVCLISGNIYMNWVAPYHLGAAGDSFTNYIISKY